MTAARVRVRRMANHVHKLRWGLRTVGVARTVRGLVRLASMRAARGKMATVPLGGGALLTFRVPDQMSPALVVFGQLIDPEYAFLRRVAKSDWVHWDVGAAVGQYTVFAAGLPSSRVEAIEPNPELRRTLTRNISLNDAGRVTRVHDLAVSDTPGKVLFAAPASPFVGRVVRGNETGGVVVEAATLDALAVRWGTERVDVLKVNVAGYEAEVLRGGRHLLAAGRVGILVVLVGASMVSTCVAMTSHGYRFFFYDTGCAGLVELPRLSLDSLAHPPSPARHVLAVHHGLIGDGHVRGVPILDPRASAP